MGSWGVRIAIIAIIIVGGFVLRDRLSSSAGDLKVGDCFDEPASGGEISDVQHHPCTESHSAEVVFLGEMTGDNSTYPTDDQFDQYAATRIVEHFRKNGVLVSGPFPILDKHIRVSLGAAADMREFWRVWDLLPVDHTLTM